MLWAGLWVMPKLSLFELTPTPNLTLEIIVHQTFHALTASVSTPTTSKTAMPTTTKVATPSATMIKTQTPFVSSTNSAPFSVIDVKLSTSGQCGNFTVFANITTNGAGSVTYHWVRSDGGVDSATHAPIYYSGEGSRSVSTGWSTISLEASGWTFTLIYPITSNMVGRTSVVHN